MEYIITETWRDKLWQQSRSSSLEICASTKIKGIPLDPLWHSVHTVQYSDILTHENDQIFSQYHQIWTELFKIMELFSKQSWNNWMVHYIDV